MALTLTDPQLIESGTAPGPLALLLLGVLLPSLLQSEPRPVITIYLEGATACHPVALQAMQSEVNAIVEPARFALEWKMIEAASKAKPVPMLIVVRLAGICNSGKHCADPRGPGPLGWTHISDGEILPFCTVNCDRVRDLLRPVLRYKLSDLRDRIYGRALGRVIAHEIYHIVANTTAHGRSGIGKPAMGALELSEDVCRFGTHEIRLMHDALNRLFSSAFLTAETAQQGVLGKGQ